MLSDNERMKQKPSKRGRAVGAVHRSWSDSQKLEAITTYLSLGNLALTSRVLNIPEMTLREWKQKDWWKEMADDLKTQETLQLSARLKRIIESTLSVTEDRLANGDYIYDNKLGQMVRKPVSMKDAHKVALDMMNRRDFLDNQQPQAVSMERIDEKLTKLAEKFEAIANNKKTEVIEVTDVIFGEVVADGDDVEDTPA